MEITRDRLVGRFFYHLGKGGVKSIPVVGELIEEIIFGTLEENEAAAEAARFNRALTEIQSRTHEQGVHLRAILNQLRSDWVFKDKILNKLNRLLDALELTDEGERRSEIPRELADPLTRYLARHMPVGSQSENEIDGILQNLLEERPHEIRLSLLRGLMGLPTQDRERLAREFNAPATAGLGAEIEAYRLLRWAESDSGCGLESLYAKKKEIAFWDDEEHSYGAFHEASRLSDGYLPEVLLVFVHGLNGDRLATWRDLPQRLLEKARIDVDVFSFGYPAGLFKEASIEHAANDLRQVLQSGGFKKYASVVFVTHSTGGLVVKHLLTNELAEVWQQIDDKTVDFQRIRSVALRAREIVNIAVPHFGGQLWLTCLGIPLYLLLAGLFWPFAKFLRFASGGAWALGHNKIPWQLRWKNSFLANLEAQYIGWIQRCDMISCPRPVSQEILAQGDVAVAMRELATRDIQGSKNKVAWDVKRAVLRGTHGSVKKLTGSERDLVVEILSQRLRRLSFREDVTVALHTAKRAISIDRESKIEELVGGVGKTNKTLNNSRGGTQKQIRDWVYQIVSLPSEYQRRVLITGDAGLGKSAVLRRVARDLSAEFLQAQDIEAALPIYLPLQQLALKDNTRKVFLSATGTGDAAWTVLRQYWCQFANGLVREQARLSGMSDERTAVLPQIEDQWVDRRLKDSPSVLILDGLDEFIMNNPGIGVAHLLTLLRQIESSYQKNRRFFVLLGARTSLGESDLLSLVNTARERLFEVLRLTSEQAEELFPGTQELLTRVHDPETRKLLLSPLVLTQLGPRISEIKDQTLETRAGIIEAALEAIIDRSGLASALDPSGHISTRTCLDALSLIAMAYFAGFRGEIPLTDLWEECDRQREQWAEFDHSALNHAMLQETFRGFSFAGVTHGETILRRTVFVSTGPGLYRFVHREWQDFLVARYLAICIRHRNFVQLAKRAFFWNIFESAAQQLRPWEITKDFVESALRATKQLQSQFVIGNLGSLFGRTHLRFGRPAILTILSRLAEIPLVARLVTLNAISFRALLNDENDPSRRELRAEIIKALEQYPEQENGKSMNQVLASLIWCYRSALAKQGACSAPELPWPALAESEDQLRDAWGMLCTETSDGPKVAAQEQSLQIGFLAVLPMVVFEGKHRAISTVHYLYPLVAVYRHGALIEALEGDLARIMDSGSQIECAIHAYTDVPELSALWAVCRDIYENK